MKNLKSKMLVLFLGVLVGGLGLWLVSLNSEFVIGTKKQLCKLDLGPGDQSVIKTFTTSEPLERFYVVAQPGKNGRGLSIVITGKNDFLCSCSGIKNSHKFSFSPGEIPPGVYKAVLKQKAGSQGGRVVISARAGLYGWQIWSRGLVGFLIFSGLLSAVFRKSKNLRLRITSLFLFQILLLAFLAIFLYLLFHEGGHALAAILFGKFDLARSDFWGIHSYPHAGSSSPDSAPWQRAVISFAGPALPTLVGWALFVFWRSGPGKKIRESRKILNLYSTAIITMLIFPFTVTPGYLLNLISDGDWQGFIQNVPGPLWLVRTLLLAAFLLNCLILWRLIPELARSWKAYQTGMELLIKHPTFHVTANSQAELPK